MELNLSTVADICGIVGFIISIFAAVGVVKINKRINSNKVNVEGTTVGGDFTGRDKKNI